MPELVSIASKDFDLIIWSKDVESSRKRLAKTLVARGKSLSGTTVLAYPAIAEKEAGLLQDEFVYTDPIFFENKQYDIEFAFKDKLKDSLSNNNPVVEHRLRSVEDAFHYSSRTNSLRATLNTRNDIGWFKIELVYQVDGKEYRQSFSFEVLPTKMDMASDLDVINSAIDEEFPLWIYSLAEKTQQQMQAAKKPHPDFLLLWLAQFEKLFDELNRGLKHIINAPHSRLLSTQNTVRMDRLKGKLSPKLEENIARAIADKQFDKRFLLNKKILSVDTPENRFIKSAISTTVSKLAKIRSASQDSKKEPDKQRLSDSFFNKLETWQSDIRYFQRQPLFKEVGSFTGLSKESLVLQQKPGYAKVYKVWQQLKWHLEMLEGDNNLSLRSVSELYEVWCFLEVRRILLSLGFSETKTKRIPLVNTGVEVSFKDGLKGAFEFERDGIHLILAHEPKFGKAGRTIKSWTTTQVPDIYLEATFPNREKIVWLFDAKYRIRDREKNDKDLDFVPDDAINQMHRYRDALIHIEKDDDNNNERKSRPVFGAYALYPGFYDQRKDINPYEKEIEEVGIGAFSLLPSDDNSGSIWLNSFLESKLARRTVKYSSAIIERHYVEEAPRIPYHGTEVTRYNDLVIVANQLGPKRDSEYIKRFSQGEAAHYHTKLLAFERQKIEHHVIQEARYLAVALDDGSGKREIEYVYPILDSVKVKRGDIGVEQSGTNTFSNPDEMYRLFKLGRSLKLKGKIKLDAERHFKIKLVGREDLSSSTDWSLLPERYTSVLQ